MSHTTLPHLFFENLEECRTLDRLRLPPPRGYAPHWSLHVVQVRPGDGDRVYGFFGTPTVIRGAFAFYPDDLRRGALEMAQWHPGAWPYFRKTPGGYRWVRQRGGIAQLVQQLGSGSTPDIARWPWGLECWYLRFEEQGHVERHFSWDDDFRPMSETWEDVRHYCRELAVQTLRLPPSLPPPPSPPAATAR